MPWPIRSRKSLRSSSPPSRPRLSGSHQPAFGQRDNVFRDPRRPLIPVTVNGWWTLKPQGTVSTLGSAFVGVGDSGGVGAPAKYGLDLIADSRSLRAMSPSPGVETTSLDRLAKRDEHSRCGQCCGRVRSGGPQSSPGCKCDRSPTGESRVEIPAIPRSEQRRHPP